MLRTSIVVAPLYLLSACGGAAPAFSIASSSFAEGQAIPKAHTCEGQDRVPALSWRGAPKGSESLVLVVEDPDAPDPAAPKITWVHWVMYDLPVSDGGVKEGGQVLPVGARHGKNGWDKTGYRGPCPPIGTHRYMHKLYALDVKLGDLGEPSRDRLTEAMKGHVLGEVQTMGTYIKTAK